MSDPDRPAEGPETAYRFSTTARRAVVALLAVAIGWAAWLWWDSRVPATYSVAPTHAGHGAQVGADGVDVVDLTADPDRPADVRMRL